MPVGGVKDPHTPTVCGGSDIILPAPLHPGTVALEPTTMSPYGDKPLCRRTATT
ncbi:hypothetical protein CZ774_13140 [Frigoribacterium sp. JB110]|nr:hypothetical protein CZ774_13140 [Frigoribacterium sp. JB110]